MFSFPIPHWVQHLPNHAKVCIFGGHVRDQFLGLPSRDIDYLISGVLPSDFPNEVFKYFPHPSTDRFILQHPTGLESQHELMLARWETEDALEDMKTSLLTRDLTVHTLGFEVKTQHWIDPSGQGLADLHAKILRMSHPDVFLVDANRVLRLARLSVQLEPFGFQLDEKTVERAIDAILTQGWNCGEDRLIRQMGLIWQHNPKSVFERLHLWGLTDTLGPWAERPLSPSRLHP